MKHIIGIDPGITGALAAVFADGQTLVADLPTIATGKSGRRAINAAALADIFDRLMTDAGDATWLCAIEAVHAMPKNGAIAGFSLGHSLGIIEGVAAALGMPVELVPSQTWKRYYRLGSDKEECRATAQRLFPSAELHLKKHHGRAEALLLARYAFGRS